MKSPRWLLFPLTLPYHLVTAIRNKCFDYGIFEERPIALPSIAVGNLAVGGTGKTPHVEYLLRLLTPYYKVATLSRGYGRSTKGLREVSVDSKVTDVGDEPLQMKVHFPEATVIVDGNRRRGTVWIEKQGADIVLLDDAFQHRYVRPHLRILLTDYNRRYTKDFLLPMGRLRESRDGAQRANIIIVTKCPSTLSQEERNKIIAELTPQKGQSVFFTTLRYSTPRPLFPDALPYIPSSEVALITGIAYPDTLTTHLTTFGKVHLLQFPDHHNFTKKDLQLIENHILSSPQAITTEKDAMRLLPYASHLCTEARQRLYVQPIEVAFLTDELLFQQTIFRYAHKD